MVYLATCRFLANHPPSIIGPIVLYALTVRRMSQLVDTAEMPDLKFGFTPKEIHELMQEQWGKEGCEAYAAATMLDLFPYMESYTVTLGFLLILGAKRQNWDDRVALASAATMAMDVGETVILRTACQVEEPLADGWIQAASIFNQLKWVLFAVSVVTIIAAFILPGKKSVKTN